MPIPQSIYRLTAQDWKAVFRHHLAWSEQKGRTIGSPAWDDCGLNVIGVRMNPVHHFYVRGTSEDWNDYLVLIEMPAAKVTVFRCTTDPAVIRVNPRGIAHLAEGCWDAYVRGRHKAPWRRALVQRTNPVLVIRTDSAGRETVRERGYFGINIHNAMGWNRPSAGCTVLKPQKIGMRDENYLRFKKIVNDAPDRPSRTYALTSAEQLRTYGYPLAEESNA